jgi:hypothetical protein
VLYSSDEHKCLPGQLVSAIHFREVEHFQLLDESDAFSVWSITRTKGCTAGMSCTIDTFCRLLMFTKE